MEVVFDEVIFDEDDEVVFPLSWKMRLSFQTFASPNGSLPKVSMLSLEAPSSAWDLVAGINNPDEDELGEEVAAAPD